MKFEWGAWLFSLAATFVVAWVDPLGATSALKRLSNNEYLDAVAGNLSKIKSEIDISVLIIEDKDLPYLGERWPVSLETHAQIIAELSSLKPRAVVVDFLFMDDRTADGVDALIASLEAAGEHHPVIYLNSTSAFGAARSGQLVEFFSQNNADKNLYASDPTITDFYEETTILPVTTTTNDGVKLPTPALAVLDGICDQESQYCDVAAMVRRHDSIQLVWPASPRQCHNTDSRQGLNCPPVTTNFFNRLFLSALATMAPRFIQDPKERLRDWYPYETISATDLLNGALMENEAEGRVVFIGGRFAGIRDFVESPTYGVLPGVYGHAAALDNMTTYNGRPYQYGRPFKMANDLFDSIYIMLVVTGLFLGRALALISRRGRPIWRVGRAVDFSIIVTLSSALAYIEVALFRTSPDNWILGPSLVSFSLLGWGIYELSGKKHVQ